MVRLLLALIVMLFPWWTLIFKFKVYNNNNIHLKEPKFKSWICTKMLGETSWNQCKLNPRNICLDPFSELLMMLKLSEKISKLAIEIIKTSQLFCFIVLMSLLSIQLSTSMEMVVAKFKHWLWYPWSPSLK